jgi:hypothetical protein
MTKWLRAALPLLLVAAAPQHPAGIIRDFQVLSTAPAYGGATPPGAAGPYEVITAVVHGALDPDNRENAGIVDLKLAPRARDGLVDYSTDVVILRPRDAKDAKRVLFYDVVNRGNKLAVPYFIGGGAPGASTPPPAGFPSLLRQGATIVWSGWQGDVAQTGGPSTALAGAIGTAFPIAHLAGGKPITGMSREEFIPDYAGGAPNVIALSYPPADQADRKDVVFTARQSWVVGYGSASPRGENYTAPSVPVTEWHYAKGPHGTTVVFTPPDKVPGPGGKMVPADAGTIYSFVYRARDPRVDGIGFAAIRDLVAFLRHDAKDAAGHPNPLADLAAGACVLASCPAHRQGNFDIAIGEGISQSGRFLKDFLYRGFNRDTHGRIVFEGMFPIISGARRAWVDDRFAQPGRWSKEHEDHWQRGDQFPFTYATLRDPVSGRQGGLLAACTASHDCPRIIQLDGAFEWWGARASLVVTDGRGHDVKLPENVRYYLVPGTQHGGGPGVTTGLATLPPAGSLCQLPGSPVAEAPVARALAHALIAWVARGTAPPASRYPTVAAGTLVAPTAAATGFPDLSDVMVPSGGVPAPLHLVFTGQLNALAVTGYQHAVPAVHMNESYTLLVPKVDRNGNAVAGVMVPDIAVPLATYTGWNLRGEGHAVGEGCISQGASIPLAADKAAEAGGHDTRATLSDLYKGRADYQAKVSAAAEALVKGGYLLPDDAAAYTARAAKVSPKLIPAP